MQYHKIVLCPHSNATSIGLIAHRKQQLGKQQLVKQQLVKRQISEPIYGQLSRPNSADCHCCCDCQPTETMVNDDVKSDFSDYFDDTALNHYEMLIDCKRSNSVESRNLDSPEDSHSNGMAVEECDDSEYEYGPGIVEKLKLKYMSISMRQQSQCRYSPSPGLKHCSSLENLIFENDTLIYDESCICYGSAQKSQTSKLYQTVGKNPVLGSIADSGNRIYGKHHSHKRQYIQHHNTRNNYHINKCAAPVLKRAKSMETLLFEDVEVQEIAKKCDHHHQSHHDNHDNHIHSLSIANDSDSIANGNVMMSNEKNVIAAADASDGNTIKGNAIKGNHIKDDDITPNRTPPNAVTNANIGNENELPKPDTVKTYKRIFESTATVNTIVENGKSSPSGVNESIKPKISYKKVITTMNGAKRKTPLIVRGTTKSAHFKSNTTVTTQPQPSPTKTCTSASMLPSPAVRSSVTNGDNNNNNNINKSAISVKPPVAPKRLSLIAKTTNSSNATSALLNKSPRLKHINGRINENTQKSIVGNSNAPKPEKPIKSIKTDAPERVKSSDTIALNETKTSHLYETSSNELFNGNQKDEQNANQMNGESDCPKVTPNKPIANIKPFNHTCGDTNGVTDGHLEHVKNVCNNFEGSAHLESKVIKCDNSRNDDKTNEKENVLKENKCNANANANVNENIASDENTPPMNSKDEIEYKPQTAQQDLQQSDVLKPSALLNVTNSTNSTNTTNPILNRNDKSPSSSLWSQQRSSNLPTSIVFDFRGKDIKPNIAIQSKPFGLFSVAKRSTVKTPKDGSKINGSSADSDDDDDDIYTGSLELPPPCQFIFIGENVRIGKGSLLITRNKKLKIQFDDTSTTTYEYPSEASFMDDVPISDEQSSLAAAAFGKVKSETNKSVISSNVSNPNTVLCTLKTNLALGGSSGGFASYKPTLLDSIDTPFQLGVSRVKKSQTQTVTNAEVSAHDSDMIVPSDPNETMSWSTSSTASDLLF